MLLADLLSLGEVALRGDDDARLTLQAVAGKINSCG